jgi:hypothetical protein
MSTCYERDGGKGAETREEAKRKIQEHTEAVMGKRTYSLR